MSIVFTCSQNIYNFSSFAFINNMVLEYGPVLTSTSSAIYCISQDCINTPCPLPSSLSSQDERVFIGEDVTTNTITEKMQNADHLLSRRATGRKDNEEQGDQQQKREQGGPSPHALQIEK